MHTGPWETGIQSHSAMSLKLIYLGLIVVAGVGGNLGRDLMRDMSGRRQSMAEEMRWSGPTSRGCDCIVKIDGKIDGSLCTEILKDGIVDVLGTLKNLRIKKNNVYF